MRSWFITGVSSGLGRALAEAVLRRGDQVAGTVRSPEAGEAFSALAPGRARAALLDVTGRQAGAAAIAEAEAAMGGIDILVNNAGYSLEGTIEATSFDQIDNQIAAHLLGPLALIKAALPAMRARRSGHVFTVGSLAAHIPGGGVALYAGLKAAIEALSIGLAQEIEPFGIKVTCVVPGAFRTRLGDSRQSATGSIADYAAADEARRAWFASWSGQQRGDPAKAAQILLDLADMPDPPRLFPLGPDAIQGFRTRAGVLSEAATLWEQIGGTTDIVSSG
jgi:NAD(P)-dependent dehydrogenase (short-subunit alcohol dehydrogenase family)